MFFKKTFCMVTGASKGFGKALCQLLIQKLPTDSVIVLTARNEKLLQALKNQFSSEHPSIRIFIWAFDMSNPSFHEFSNFFQKLFKDNGMKADDFEQCLLVHNAATPGELNQLQLAKTNRKDIDDYWTTNITAVVLLNSVFLPLFNNKQRRCLLNTTSLAAIKPLKGFSLYSASKAAREVLLQNLLLEEPDLCLLHWSPGPMKTDFVKGLSDFCADPLVAASMQEGVVLSPEQSARKLLKVLEKDTFKSGDRFDYYDVDEDGNLITQQ